jgi:hypothetical protein
MKFKDDIVSIRFEDMHKMARTIATDMDAYTQKQWGIELMVTATVSTSAEDKLLERVSDTHRSRRAFDVRTSNLEEDQIADLMEYTNLRYGKYGAIASALPKLIVSKPHGSGPHLHIQLSRKFALPEIKYGL